MQGFIERWLFDPTIGRIVAAAIGLLVIFALVRFVQQRVIGRYVRDPDARYRVRRVVTILGVAVGIFYVATVFSGRFGQLTVVFGVFGAGIAFALQEVIASVAGWLAVSFGGFYSIGDRVQLGGIKGDVVDIGVLRTTLMEVGEWVNGDVYNGRIVRIANSFVFKEPVSNYSASFPFLWDEIVVPIKHGSDYQLARAILQRAATEVTSEDAAQARSAWEAMMKRYPIEDASVDPMVTFIVNDNWLEFTLRYVVDYRKRRSTKDQLFTYILDELGLAQGRVSLASMTVHLVETPTFNVHLTGGDPKAQ